MESSSSEGFRYPKDLSFKCFHYPGTIDRPSDFEKWFYNAFKDDLPATKTTTPESCAMCYGIGYRYGWTNKNNEKKRILTQSPDIHKNLLDVEAFDKGISKAEDMYLKMWNDPQSMGIFKYKPMVEHGIIPVNLKESLAFPISQESYGEVFHLAVAKILHPKMIKISANSFETVNKAQSVVANPTDTKASDTKASDIKASDTKASDTKASDTKARDTSKKSYDLLQFYGLITDPKKAEQNSKKAEQEQALHLLTKIIADTFDQNYEQQEKVFLMIRSVFERSPASTDPEKSRCTLSSLGSYYLSCFLKLNGRSQLPELGENESVALIFVRGIPKDSNDNRIMTSSNIKKCLSAIKQANETTSEPDQGRRKFKHVVLFGDLLKVDEEARMLYTKLCGTDISIITQPWSGKGELDDPGKSRQFWAEFREEGKVFRPGWEGVPFQVKNLSLFLALQKQYGDNLCCIGFRSGFLDVAAFLGTPIFYIDKVLTLDKKEPQQWLWKISHHSNRMVDASNKINTFIRLDLPKNEKNEEWELSNNDMDRLGAALYTYMLHGQGKPLWTKKVAMFKQAEDKVVTPAETSILAALKQAK